MQIFSAESPSDVNNVQDNNLIKTCKAQWLRFKTVLYTRIIFTERKYIQKSQLFSVGEGKAACCHWTILYLVF